MSKNKQPKNIGSERLANFFGVLGYLSLVLEWAWIAALYLPLLIENETAKRFLLPDQTTKPQQVGDIANEPSLLLIAVAVTVTFIVVVASVVLLVRLPLRIARTSHKVIERTAAASIPIITHHKKISKNKRKILTVRIIYWLKIIGAMLPLVALFGSYFVEVQLSRDIFVLVGLTLAVMTLLNFTLQYLVARWRSVSGEKLL